MSKSLLYNVLTKRNPAVQINPQRTHCPEFLNLGGIN